MPFIPYLTFQGNAAEAFAFYAEVFGGTPFVMRFADMPEGEGPPGLRNEIRDWALHVSLATPDGMLMASDAPPEFGGEAQAGVSVSVTRPDFATSQALFERLAEGGTVSMPFGKTFFAEGYGMCRDRFGTHWMVSVADTADRSTP
ncbi:VOC family protein [Paracoccus sp. S-4012]|uniref:VOC family protein n=1 Tax=Paracoccus sp. S-4012 TaxID=2665648 RepID=UPI0012AFAC19|nr:VOC family protein [Paracoccus sp. S-4012]MRX49745.1 VOC family protein [Paracoccus sp. S-4012]